MFRIAFLSLSLLAACGALASEADVLRYNYKKSPATRPAVPAPAKQAAPATTRPIAQASAITASIRLGPR